jgi:hypothetical protein
VLSVVSAGNGVFYCVVDLAAAIPECSGCIADKPRRELGQAADRYSLMSSATVVFTAPALYAIAH